MCTDSKTKDEKSLKSSSISERLKKILHSKADPKLDVKYMTGVKRSSKKATSSR